MARVNLDNLDNQLGKALRNFWETRSRQSRNQGARTGSRDYGNRTAATGGKQLDGFVYLISSILKKNGIAEGYIYKDGRADVTLPGYFRPTKQWDILIIAHSRLIAAIELKALCGPSYGNNYNNRVEEAIGSATDFWTAYREEVFGRSPRPFLGYLLIVEQSEKSNTPVSVTEKHFEADELFRDSSYIRRCQGSLKRLILERTYDCASLLTSEKPRNRKISYSEPDDSLTIEHFLRSLVLHVKANIELAADLDSGN